MESPFFAEDCQHITTTVLTCTYCTRYKSSLTCYFVFITKYSNNVPVIPPASNIPLFSINSALRLSTLNLFYQNVRGLRTKLTNLKSIIPLFHSYDVIILTETWLHPDILSSELGLFNFLVYRYDRCPLTSSHGRGGGVLVAVRTSIKSFPIHEYTVHVEQLFVVISFGSFKLLICAVYLPPSSSLPMYEAHTSSVEKVLSSISPSHILLCGDYNLPNINWVSSDSRLGLAASGNLSSMSSHLIDSFAFLNLFQLNRVHNSHGGLLDLVFSTSDKPSVTTALSSLVNPDSFHPPLCINYPIEFYDPQPAIHSFRDFKSGDYTAISLFLDSFDWENTFLSLSLEESASLFNDVLLNAIDKYVPLKVFSPSKFPRWTSHHLKSLIFDKKQAHKKFKCTSSPKDYLVFSELRAKCKQRSNFDHCAYIKQTEQALSLSPSRFWSYVRNLKQAPSIPSTVHFNNVSSNSEIESANLFVSYFSSTYNHSPSPLQSRSLSLGQLPYDLPSNITFTPKDVNFLLDSLANSFSNGPDGISARCLYYCRNSITNPLFLLYRRSLSEGIFPSVWKICSVTPVLKAGDPSDVANYRPISIIPHLAKLFESLVYSNVKRSLNHLLIDEQHGFRPGKSTVTSSVAFTTYLLDNIEKGGQVDVVFTDFKKAFDTVDHGLLINELGQLGIGDPLLSWLRSYLSNRQQFVKVNNSESSLVTIPSGVPQGGHLSPLLFILFVNSISKSITKAKFLLFADDIKIYLKSNDISDSLTLQHQLDNFAQWVQRLSLTLNLDKCFIMSFSRRHNPALYSYHINNSPLKRVFIIKDLGMHFSPSLDFSHHINITACKALKVMGFIKRNTKMFSSLHCLRTLYLCLVRPILEYGMIVWHPYLAKDQLRLERVQNRFLSYASFLLKIDHPQHDYSPVLSKLNIPTLSSRRINADIRFIQGLLDGSIDAPDLLSSINFRVPTYPTRHPTPFLIPTHFTSYGNNHPLHRMLRFVNNAM